MQGTAEIKELRDTLGVKVKFSIAESRAFDSDSQSQTPNSTGDIAEHWPAMTEMYTRL